MIGSALFIDPPASGRAPPPGPRGSDSDPSPARLGRGRILIVEDEYLVALSNEWALSDAGFEVLGTVATGEEALAAAAERAPDLVVMDIRLGGRLDGIETALALRAGGIPSLFASAHSDPGTLDRGQAAQPVGWLRKPFSESSLVAAVEEALARLRRS